MSVEPQKAKPADLPPASQPEPMVEDEERDDTIIAVALRYSLLAIVLIAAAGGGLYWWLTRPEVEAEVAVQPPAPPRVRALPEIELPQVPFVDFTDESGIDFVHENGAYESNKLLPETMGGGCAFLDYNSDGHIDILFVNSRRWPWDARPAAQVPATLALYQNDGRGKFINATDAAGLAVTLYGQGCAVGDFDNDGDPDVFISAVTPRESLEDGQADQPGPHRLFRNDDGQFVDMTAEAGVSGRYGDWGSSTGWFDYDNDGDLDLWVCNYVVWSREFDASQNFSLVGVGRGYGRPQNFEGTFSQLFRNDGGGRFTDVSAEAGIQVKNPLKGTPMGKSLGVAFADFDGDGWQDVAVANDTVQKFLFHNNRNGTFDEIGAVAGFAFDSSGSATGAMGIDIGCPRNKADCFAVTIGNFSNEMTAFYVSLPGTLLFSDEAVSNGLGPNTRLQLTFGVFFFDADLDGRLDFFGANGHLEEDIAKVQASQTYEQPPQLFWNAGAQHATEFVPLTAKECGEDFFRPIVGRGAAYADIDSDGDLDVLIGASGRRPRLLRNDQQLGHHWLRLKLQGNGATSNRDAIGARVDLTVGGEVRRQFVTRTRSYISQSESTLTFGLGDSAAIDKVEIRWPDGKEQTLQGLAVDTVHAVKQGN
jgi:hypothetical protein